MNKSALHATVLSAAVMLMTVTRADAQGRRAPVLLLRLIEASEQGETAQDDALADVLPVLKRNLGFDAYRLLSARKQPLTGNFSLVLADGYRLSATEVDGAEMTLKLARERERILETRLRLRPGRPVILGGFPYENHNRKLIIILKLVDSDDDAAPARSADPAIPATSR